MSHSYAQNHVHLVFSTKNREKTIGGNFYRVYGPTPPLSARTTIS